VKGPARLKLRRPLERAISAGHPWVYGEALEPARGLTVGAEVELLTRNGRPLARGLYDPGSPLALRVYTLDPRETLDDAFLARRLRRALSLRRGAFDDERTSAFRWCNGEGDLLPGVVVDRYDHVVVLRFDGAAARTLAARLVPALQTVAAELGLRIDRGYERARGGAGQVLFGAPPPERVPIVEHGVRFAVDVLRGQKTGFFLDQRENRRRVRLWSKGRTVANLFSYTGGFSVNAALGGARRVVSVDVAPAAIEAARACFGDNGLDPAAHVFFAEDAFAWLKREREARAQYDLVVTDPPSFAPSEKALPAALAAYRDLNAEAIALVPDGGLLCAASCSSHVDLEAFLGALAEAARAARRPLTVLEEHGQPLDHPSPPGFPEGRYLKFVVCRVG
jgi:23S rRNA (cytosine1962-C5)-methyltransferase